MISCCNRIVRLLKRHHYFPHDNYTFNLIPLTSSVRKLVIRAAKYEDITTFTRNITIMSYERYGVWNHVHIECFFNRFFKKISKVCVTGPMCGKSTGERWIPLAKGQLCGMPPFHFITAPWFKLYYHIIGYQKTKSALTILLSLSTPISCYKNLVMRLVKIYLWRLFASSRGQISFSEIIVPISQFSFLAVYNYFMKYVIYYLVGIVSCSSFRAHSVNGVPRASRCLRSTATRRSVQQLDRANSKQNIKVLPDWLFLRGIFGWLFGSPHKRSVARKVIPCRGVILTLK